MISALTRHICQRAINYRATASTCLKIALDTFKASSQPTASNVRVRSWKQAIEETRINFRKALSDGNKK